MIKVLILSTYKEYTGANQCIVDLTKNLKKDIDFIVANTEQSLLNEKLNEINVKNINIKSFQDVTPISKKNSIKVKLKKPIKKLMNLIAEYKIYRLIKKENIDIVHINSSASSIGLVAAHLAKVKTLWHLREFVTEDQNNLFWDEEKRVKQMNSVDKLIAVSYSVKEKFYRIGVNDIEVIYDGVDVSNYKPRKIEKKKEYNITIAGTISQSKGQLDAVKAMKYLENVRNDVKLNIYGVGNENYLKQLMKESNLLGNNNIINFRGFSQNISEVWNSADVALICSKKEAFGRVTAEALASGCMVIGTNTGGTGELLGNDRGYSYNYGDYEKLAQQIEYGLNNLDETNNRIKNAQHFALNNLNDKLNSKKILYKYLELFKK